MPDDAAMPPAGAVDLSNCAREPIHVPGFTQAFGVLLAAPAGRERISQISNNTELIFGVSPSEIVGQEIASVLGDKNALAINDVFQSGNWKETNPLKISIERNGNTLPLNVILHRYDGLDFIEIEAVSKEGAESATRSYHLVQSALLRLQKSMNMPDLWETVVSEVHRITGYDRVMVYRFDRDDHGFVIAERKP